MHERVTKESWCVFIEALLWKRSLPGKNFKICIFDPQFQNVHKHGSLIFQLLFSKDRPHSGNTEVPLRHRVYFSNGVVDIYWLQHRTRYVLYAAHAWFDPGTATAILMHFQALSTVPQRSKPTKTTYVSYTIITTTDAPTQYWRFSRRGNVTEKEKSLSLPPDKFSWNLISWGFKFVHIFRFWSKRKQKHPLYMKFVLEQAMKAQRGSRGIALLFL